MRIGEETGLWLIDTDRKNSQRRRIRGLGRFSWEEILMCMSTEGRSRRGAVAYIKAFGCYCNTASKTNKTGVGCVAPTSPLSWPRNRHTYQNEKATHQTVNTQSFPAQRF